jgi:hypothetical protein
MALEALKSVCESYTEGFDLPDLEAARRLLTSAEMG